MLIALDSPLRRLPIGLDRAQTLFIDGVRVSAEIIDLAYTRLVQTLEHLAQPDCPQTERGIGIISAVQDGWSIVDSAHRFRCLLRQMPRVKKRGAALEVFYRATEEVEGLRHVIQHLDSEIPTLIKLGVPVWGTLQWLVVVDRSTWLMRTSTIAAGTAFDADHPVQNPAGKRMRATVDHVILSASALSADLSDVFYEVGTLVQRMEKRLAKRFSADLPAYGSDLITTIDLQPILEDETDAGDSPKPAV